MEKNISTDESRIRIIVGAILILFAMFIVENAVLRIIIATISAILAGTSFLRVCPLYYVLKKNTLAEQVDDEGEREEVEAGDTKEEIVESETQKEVQHEDPTTNSVPENSEEVSKQG